MTFIRASEPFQEPPRRQPHGPWMIGTAVLFLFFVPLLVITAEQQHTPGPAKASAPPPRPAGALLPPLPPPGAPWPPPPGDPQPPTCALGYQRGADGRAAWVALTTLAGRLTVRTGAGAAPQRVDEPEGVHPVALTAATAPQDVLQATLSAADGESFDCVIGQLAQRRVPPG